MLSVPAKQGCLETCLKGFLAYPVLIVNCHDGVCSVRNGYKIRGLIAVKAQRVNCIRKEAAEAVGKREQAQQAASSADVPLDLAFHI
jgi:hypothetical protein